MAVPGIPFRVYFFDDARVAWFDQDADGRRTHHRSSLEQLWPDLPLVPTFGIPPPWWVWDAYPVAPSVLCLNDVVYVDVRRGAPVPWVYRSPRNDPPQPGDGGAHRVISWDSGPVLRTGTRLEDVRTGLVRRVAPLALPDDVRPILKVPGEKVRQFPVGQPQQVRITGQFTLVPFSNEFPGVFVDKVDAATVLYGDFGRPSLAEATVYLDGADVQALIGMSDIPEVGPGRGRGLLAALYLLSGLAPTSYHPDGHFGLAHMTAEQLVVAGWTDEPAAVLTAGAARQVELLEAYLRSPGVEGLDSSGRVLAALATGHPLPTTAGADTVVVAPPVPSRLLNLLPPGADTLCLGDLERCTDELLTTPAGREIVARLAEDRLEPAGSGV